MDFFLLSLIQDTKTFSFSPHFLLKLFKLLKLLNKKPVVLYIIAMSMEDGMGSENAIFGE